MTEEAREREAQEYARRHPVAGPYPNDARRSRAIKAERELVALDERWQMLLDDKDYWAERAHRAEEQVASYRKTDQQSGVAISRAAEREYELEKWKHRAQVFQGAAEAAEQHIKILNTASDRRSDEIRDILRPFSLDSMAPIDGIKALAMRAEQYKAQIRALEDVAGLKGGTEHTKGQIEPPSQRAIPNCSCIKLTTSLTPMQELSTGEILLYGTWDWCGQRVKFIANRDCSICGGTGHKSPISDKGEIGSCSPFRVGVRVRDIESGAPGVIVRSADPKRHDWIVDFHENGVHPKCSAELELDPEPPPLPNSRKFWRCAFCGVNWGSHLFEDLKTSTHLCCSCIDRYHEEHGRKSGIDHSVCEKNADFWTRRGKAWQPGDEDRERAERSAVAQQQVQRPETGIAQESKSAPLRLLVEVVPEKDEKHPYWVWCKGGVRLDCRADRSDPAAFPGEAMSVKELPAMPDFNTLADTFWHASRTVPVSTDVQSGIRAVLKAVGLEIE